MAQQETSFADIVRRVEPKWQAYWDQHGTFQAANPGEKGSEKPKYYVLDMFPYPSGDGLHIGHPLGYTATDILARYKRARGFNVLHPMGWDAFGLPAEQYAIKHGVNPAETTAKNIVTFKRQLKSLGFSYDWNREISTIDPKYYRWTQWIFKKLYERGLAYETEMLVNWCPELGTVLANDEIIDGKSERGGHPVERKPMRQWVLKITDYAERLLQDLDTVDWPDSTKEHQRNWIGKSVGARLRFRTERSGAEIEVFTTRPDTLFGVSFVALAPEHALVASLTAPEQKAAVDAYVLAASRKSDIQRTDLAKGKSGVFLGSYAIHPLTGAKVPVWIADYILVNYGSGAIMGVPAHDERDREFAEAMELPVLPVIDANDQLVNSTANFDGLSVKDGAAKIVAHLEQSGRGKQAVTYRLRDAIFSRQRYWGEPVPVIKVIEGADRGQMRLLDDSELPLELPKVQRYQPTGTGESPLTAIAEWVNTKDPVTGAAAVRETNTMPGYAGSSWYWLRYMDPRNDDQAWGPAVEKYWGQVDFYMGGSEHAVGHLLYSRFWQKVFFDLGLVSSSEPFHKLVHQGMILAENGEKMSKSRGNVVNPDSVVAQYGADTLRLFEMFLGPIEKAKPWQTQSIEGVYRFLQRYWRLAANDDGTAPSPTLSDAPETQWDPALVRAYHKCVRQVTEDIERLAFNTAISAMMTFVNELYGFAGSGSQTPRQAIATLAQLLGPFAPHLAEEVWSLLGHPETIAFAAWPTYDAAKTSTDEFQLAIQVNGKLRATRQVSKQITEAELRPQVLGMEAVQKWTEGKEPKKFIYVKEKLVSIVV